MDNSGMAAAASRSLISRYTCGIVCTLCTRLYTYLYSCIFIYCTDIYVHTFMHVHLRMHSFEGGRVFTRHEPANTGGSNAQRNPTNNPQTAPRPPRADTVADFQHQPPAIFALIAPVSPRACFPLDVTLLKISLAAANVDGFYSRATPRCSSSRRSNREDCELWGSLDISNGW